MKKRVVVTGLGVISPAGCCKQELWENVTSGVSCISKLIFKVPEYEKLPSKVAGIVPSEKYKELIRISGIQEPTLRSMTKTTCMAILAAKEAIEDAQLDQMSTQLKENTGVAIGSGLPDFEDISVSKNILDKSYNRLSPYFMPRILQNMASGHISIQYGFLGPNHCVSTACATGTHSIGDSFKMIQNGYATVMVCGGSDAAINPLTIAGFCRIRALSTNFNDTPGKASRPFDKKRDGFVVSEGAAVLILEEMNHALSRNARIYAEILGYGLSGDASSLTTPDPLGKGALLSMQKALKDAGTVTVRDISYVNAHATSTPLGDNIELNAIATLFRECPSVCVSSLKGCFGHLLGAAGSIETLCTALACYEAKLLANINLEDSCLESKHLICLSSVEEWKSVTKRIALKNSFGFGGTNATLCISEFQV